MKIVGLITEYNPFHNGHLYHIEQAKKMSNADYVIVVMSGNFVQRGGPAFLPKHIRTDIALNAGADLILELPVCFATGSAEFFALGAVSILDKLACVDEICFGSECGDYYMLEKIAHVIAEEPAAYKEVLKQCLKEGVSFPIARQNALKAYFKDDAIDTVLEQPNNILGIEYIKALYQLKSPMKGYTIHRISSNYHDETLKNDFSSASAIRRAITKTNSSSDIFDIRNQIPIYAFETFKNIYKKRFPIVPNDFSLLLRYKLFNETAESLCRYMDVTQDLANRIINTRNQFLDFEQYCELLKSRELTYSRISRVLIHILLNIKNIDTTPHYARVLGFRKSADAILTLIKKDSSIPLITKLSKINSLSDKGLKMLEQDIYASNLYENVVSHKFNEPFIHELSQQIIVLK